MYILLVIFGFISAFGMTMHFMMGNIFQGLMGIDFLVLMYITYELGKKQSAKWFSDIDFPMWFKLYIVLPSLGFLAINTGFSAYEYPAGFMKYSGYFFVFVLLVTMVTSYYSIYKEIRGNKHD